MKLYQVDGYDGLSLLGEIRQMAKEHDIEPVAFYAFGYESIEILDADTDRVVTRYHGTIRRHRIYHGRYQSWFRYDGLVIHLDQCVRI